MPPRTCSALGEASRPAPQTGRARQFRGGVAPVSVRPLADVPTPNFRFLPVAMFLGSFAWSFVYVSLPFHIQHISTVDPVATLRWTGWILGVSSLVTVVTAPLWGGVATRGNPMRLYVVVQFLQALCFFAMAAARTLVELFLTRLVLGVAGAASTFAFVLSGRAGDPREVRRQVAAVQSAMTIGQVIGPLAGAIVAARLGFRTSFVVGGLVLVGCGLLVLWGVPPAPAPADAPAAEHPAPVGEVVAVALVVLAGSVQIFFLASVLPQVLPRLGVAPEDTLEIGGIVIFLSGAAAALGALLTGLMSELAPERRLLVALLTISSVCVAVLGAARSVWLFGALRFVQVLSIAPVFPLVVARIAQHASGRAIGLVNSARIAAAFAGPVAATSVLAWTAPALVYLTMAAMGLVCVPLVAHRRWRGQ